jgi:cytochrome c biogenesis protein CcdA
VFSSILENSQAAMKIIKIALGTVFGLATVGYLAQFLQTLINFILVWVRVGYSPRGLADTGAALAALCIGATFTIWTFKSAFRRSTPKQEQTEDGASPELEEPDFWDRFLAVLSIALFWAPCVGLVVAVIAFLQNYLVRGWPRTVSRIGALLALLVNIAVLILWLWDWIWILAVRCHVLSAAAAVLTPATT